MPETLHKMTPEEQEALQKAQRELFFKYENPTGDLGEETRGRPPLARTEPKKNEELRLIRDAWAAGCVETRGTLIVQQGAIRFQLHSKNIGMLKNLESHFGGTASRKAGGFQWVLSGRGKVNDFLDAIGHWLTKARKAELERKRETLLTVDYPKLRGEKARGASWENDPDEHEEPLTGRFIGALE